MIPEMIEAYDKMKKKNKSANPAFIDREQTRPMDYSTVWSNLLFQHNSGFRNDKPSKKNRKAFNTFLAKNFLFV